MKGSRGASVGHETCGTKLKYQPPIHSHVCQASIAVDTYESAEVMSLSGCSVAISGRFVGYTQVELKALISSNGANFEPSGITSTATHLITELPDFQKPGRKLRDAWDRNIPAVSLDWLLDSALQNKKLDEADYLYKQLDDQRDDAQAEGKKRKKGEGVKNMPAKRQRGGEAESEPAAVNLQGTVTHEEEEPVEEKSKGGRVEGTGPKNQNEPTKEPAGNDVKSEINSKRASVMDAVLKTGQGDGARRASGEGAGSAGGDVKPGPEVIVLEEKQQPKPKEAPRKRGRGRPRGRGSRAGVRRGDTARVEPRKSGRPQKQIVEVEAAEEDGACEKPKKVGRPWGKVVRVEAVEDIACEEPKERRPESDAKEAPANDIVPQKKPNAKFAKLNVSVEAGCPLTATHHVYIGPSGTVFDAALSQADFGWDNDKFYNIQILESNIGLTYATWTRWGRVGEFGQTALFGNQPLAESINVFETKFRVKSGLKWEERHEAPIPERYTFIEKNYMDEELVNAKGVGKGTKSELKPVPVSKLSPELQSLMQLIFNPDHMNSSMASMRYDANKLPIGKLSKDILNQGFAALKVLGEIVINRALAGPKYGKPAWEVLGDLTSKYYAVIPHDFGRMRPPVIDSEEILKKEIELVETLGDMQIANEIMKDAAHPVDADGNQVHSLDLQFKSLDLEEAATVDKSTTEFAELEVYLLKSQKPNSWSEKCKLIEVFRITRPGEAKRFEDGGFSAAKIFAHNIGDARKLLWYGSRTTNFGGILSQGLRIVPEAPANGYAFGKGIYLADLASTSCDYVHPNTSNNQGLLMLCEAQLGDPVYETCSDPDAASNSKKLGALSTWAQGGTQPKGWKDAGAVSQELKGVLMPDMDKGLAVPENMPSGWIPDNEYIVYSVAQVKIRYLFRVGFS